MTLNRQRLEAALETLQGLTEPENAHLNNFLRGFDLHLFDCIPSTNQTLWELMNSGAKAGTVVIASTQTAGRGQWGRQWQSHSGGLYLSLAIEPQILACQQAQLTLAGAWGIATMLRSYDIPVDLKWPNDLLLKKRKLGGILTETKVSQGKIIRAVIGVGINWENAVPETGINLQTYLTQYSDSVKVHSIEMLAALVLQGLKIGLQQLSHIGIEPLLKSYSQLLTCLGDRINIAEKSGRIIGVNAAGELRVQLDSPQNNKFEEITIQPGQISLGYS
ncbi:MAG: biotin--[acetyl-CoA-carboxylase] ligase [Cyanobacteriota bacterium]|nr:biotin--[acetyl-CoA-carboxylase] ligase [Cyanobacteriota bacterium]